ncbi:MAG: hypothetical protein ACYC7L_01185 [Nitrospirota bacterium]
MKRIIGCLLSVVFCMPLLGCGATAKMIAAKTQGDKSDVFTEVAGLEPVPAGYADVLITADIKTHLEGYYKGESGTSAHGKEFYPFLFNIDGQAVLWKADGKKHELPKYDADGKTSRDPEAGTGMKYTLSRKIRLRAGAHVFFFGLPENTYYKEFTITLKDGQILTLDLRPHYWYKKIPTRIPTFLKGVNRYDIFLDGARID